MCSVIIFIKEITSNPPFFEWFKMNTIVLGIVTLISCMEIEILHVLVSNVGKLEIFNAPLSIQALGLMLRASVFCFLIEDIPQLIILVRESYTVYNTVRHIVYFNLSFFIQIR